MKIEGGYVKQLL